MPKKTRKICARAGCYNDTDRTYCEDCEVAKKTAAVGEARRKTPRNPIYQTARWRKLSTIYREKHPWCKRCMELGDVTLAEHVDHIIPISEGGEVFVEENLQGLCVSCHNAKTRSDEVRIREKPLSISAEMENTDRITIICGPPGAGQDDYVKEKMLEGDLIIDLDKIYSALSGLEEYNKPHELLTYVLAAKDAVIRRLAEEVRCRHAFVISGSPKIEDRNKLGRLLRTSNIVVLTKTISECLANIASDERRNEKLEQWEELVRNWWFQYTK